MKAHSQIKNLARIAAVFFSTILLVLKIPMIQVRASEEVISSPQFTPGGIIFIVSGAPESGMEATLMVVNRTTLTGPTPVLSEISNAVHIDQKTVYNGVNFFIFPYNPDDNLRVHLGGDNGVDYQYIDLKEAGVSLSGLVKSYNPKNQTTIELLRDNELIDTKFIFPNTESGQDTKGFTFANVEAGTYDLVITKQGHLPYTIKNVVVSDTNIDISKYIIQLVCGDVNGNGTINLADISEISKSTRFNKVEANKNGYDSIYDVNGNGVIELTDIAIVFNSYNFQKTTSNCIIGFSEILRQINT